MEITFQNKKISFYNPEFFSHGWLTIISNWRLNSQMLKTDQFRRESTYRKIIFNESFREDREWSHVTQPKFNFYFFGDNHRKMGVRSKKTIITMSPRETVFLWQFWIFRYTLQELFGKYLWFRTNGFYFRLIRIKWPSSTTWSLV